MSRARDLVKEFEACTLPAEAFRMDYAAAEKRISESIRKYAEHYSDTSKYHHTLNVVWMRLVASAIRQNPGIDEFESFAAESQAVRAHGAASVLLTLLVAE